MDDAQKALNAATARLGAVREKLRVSVDLIGQFNVPADKLSELNQIVDEVESCAIELDRIKLGRAK